MRAAAAALLGGLDPAARGRVARPFGDRDRRRLEYRPASRPGASLGELDPDSRKNAHKLLATALSPPAYAQAMAIVALEEVLDRKEGWRRGRNSNDYSVVLFGAPQDELWAWRFEGHHISLTMTLRGDTVWPTPVFLGANPARTTLAGHPVLRPLAPEEDLARALMSTMDAETRAAAVVAVEAPDDIHTGPYADLGGPLEPRGVSARRLDPAGRALLHQIVAVYLARLPADLAAAELARIDLDGLHFAWEGAPSPESPDGARRPEGGHYYRIHGPDLIIEFDNQDNGANHAHTVLRRPGRDFGDHDILAAHRAASP
jgi:hypothetical protein